MTDHAPAQPQISRTVLAVVSALFIFFWASGFVAAKYGLPYAEPFTLMAARFVVATVIMVPACFILKASWPGSPRKAMHIMIAGIGIQVFYLSGVYYGLRERISRNNWIGLVLGFIGLALVVWDRVASPTDTLWGMGALLAALVGITLGTLYQKKYCGSFDIRTGVALQTVVSCIVMLGLAATFETMQIKWTADFVFAVLWSAVGLSVIASCLFYWLIQRGAATRVTSLIYLSPPTTALMGWAMFNEIMSWLAIAGMLVVMAGVAMAVRSR